MIDRHLVAVTHALSNLPTRRHVLRGLTGLGLALGTAWPSADGEAKKRKKKGKGKGKKRKKKTSPPPLPPTVPPPLPTPNQYGCLSVDMPCTNAAECCTGTCEGGFCRAHGTGTCQQDRDGICHADNQLGTLCNNSQTCACYETTGASKFCGDFSPNSALGCADCTKDADCLALGFPAGSACVPVYSGNCAGVCASGMLCLPPCAA